MEIHSVKGGYFYGSMAEPSMLPAHASPAVFSGTREAWLLEGVSRLHDRVFNPVIGGAEFPRVKISVGFPRGSRGKSKAIGQCWPKQVASDGAFHIFVCPTLDNPSRVLATVAHELVHAVVGTECGHRGAFKDTAVKIGLAGKMTATHAGPELSAILDGMVREIGTYPHGRLNPSELGGKKGSPLKKVQCEFCGYIARITRQWLNDMGAPICPCVVEMARADGVDSPTRGEFTPMTVME